LLEHFISEYAAYHADTFARIDAGQPAVRILELAEEEKADLIVMGTHGVSGYEAILMGSVTNKVLHKASVPVLAVCKPTRAVLSGDPAEPLLIGKILCAVDPEQPQIETVSRAMSLARRNRSSIIFFSVQESMEEPVVFRDLRVLIQPEKETECHVQFMQSSGYPVQEILKVIESEEVDLLVMGHRSITPAAIEVLGSVTLRVIPRSICPVLVLRN
jgi:nucleotide-binding universal stress UspA family protein